MFATTRKYGDPIVVCNCLQDLSWEEKHNYQERTSTDQ